jgi:hypothetical protein
VYLYPEEILLIVTTILILPAIIFGMYAQFKVQGAFNRYSEFMSINGETGYTIARRLLDANGCGHIGIVESPGHLSDHYDPKKKVVALSHDVYHSSSLAALGVAAHEVGHAVQDHTGYVPLKIRQLIIRSTRLINYALLPLIIIGFLGMFLAPSMLGEEFYFWFIIAMTAMYGLSVLINLITLPTEYDASRRAKRMLEEDKAIRCEDEMQGVSKVLNAAALTYVAALIVSLVYFLRLLSILLLRRRR